MLHALVITGFIVGFLAVFTGITLLYRVIKNK